MTMLETVGGYYCNTCDIYHRNNEMIHRYTVETLGEWCGQPATEKVHEILCPRCRDGEELEEFDPFQWTHLRAYKKATEEKMVFIFPLFDHANTGETYGWEGTDSVEELEEIADLYCIEVLKIEDTEKGFRVTVDFQ